MVAGAVIRLQFGLVGVNVMGRGKELEQISGVIQSGGVDFCEGIMCACLNI